MPTTPAAWDGAEERQRGGGDHGEVDKKWCTVRALCLLSLNTRHGRLQRNGVLSLVLSNRGVDTLLHVSKFRVQDTKQYCL